MSFARTSAQTLRLRAAPVARSTVRTRGIRLNSTTAGSGSGPSAGGNPAVAGALAGAGAAIVIGYGAYKYTVSRRNYQLFFFFLKRPLTGSPFDLCNSTGCGQGCTDLHSNQVIRQCCR